MRENHDGIMQRVEDLRVSAIVPTRNCGAFLPAAAACVEAQNQQNLELLVVDDCSTDDTSSYLHRLQERVPGVVVLNGEGRGPGAARNMAIDEARAPLVAFLDADDVWLPGKLERQLAFHHRHPEVVFSFCDYLHVDSAGVSHGTSFEYNTRFRRIAGPPHPDYRLLDGAYPNLLAENVVGTSTVVARRDALCRIGGFDESLSSASDWDLWLRLALEGPVAYSWHVGARYLMGRPEAVSRATRRRVDAERQIVERHARHCATVQGGRQAIRRARARVMTSEAELADGEGRYARSVSASLCAFGLDPTVRNLRSCAARLVGIPKRGAR